MGTWNACISMATLQRLLAVGLLMVASTAVAMADINSAGPTSATTFYHAEFYYEK